ncbi:MAG: regulatory protein RecX [Firmicutes bacterium]|nr:regulatory protein RecX [Bacillota bacterium]
MSSPGALEAAARLLARRDYTRQELRQRLANKGFAAAEVEEALARLMAWGYLDERALARRLVEEAITRRPRGRAFVVAELKARGIPDEIIAESLAFYPPAMEEEVARKVLTRLGYTLPPPLGERPRVWRTLLRLGFPETLVAHLCGIPET